jgi:hypothetical protein
MLTLASAGRADDVRILHRDFVEPLPHIRVTCEEVIAKCDAALAAKNTQIKKLELGLTAQTERVADLSSQLEDKNSQLQAWYRNPFVVGALGLVAGAAIITFAK